MISRILLELFNSTSCLNFWWHYAFPLCLIINYVLLLEAEQITFSNGFMYYKTYVLWLIGKPLYYHINYDYRDNYYSTTLHRCHLTKLVSKHKLSQLINIYTYEESSSYWKDMHVVLIFDDIKVSIAVEEINRSISYICFNFREHESLFFLSFFNIQIPNKF